MSNYGENVYVGVYWRDNSFYVYVTDSGDTLKYTETEAQLDLKSFILNERDLEAAKVNGTHHAISTELLEQLLGVVVE